MGAWAQIGARLRSHVLRDRYTRDIEAKPKYEEPTRLQEQLDQLAGALIVVGANPAEITSVWQAARSADVSPTDSTWCWLSSVDTRRSPRPPSRDSPGSAPTPSAQRHLEDLYALGMVERSGTGLQHNPYLWRISDLFLDWWNTANGVERDDTVITPLRSVEDVVRAFDGLTLDEGPP